MNGLLALLLLPLAFSSGSSGPQANQTICPPETERGRELVVGYATREHRVRLLTDRSRKDRVACERLSQVVAAQRRNVPGSLEGFHVTYYAVERYYYAIAIPIEPPVQVIGPGRVRVRLRQSPLYITDGTFRLIRGVAM